MPPKKGLKPLHFGDQDEDPCTEWSHIETQINKPQYGEIKQKMS